MIDFARLFPLQVLQVAFVLDKNEDFPALSSSTAPSKPEPQTTKLENGEPATASNEPVTVVKRGLGDGDHSEANKQPKASFNRSKDSEPSYRKQTQQAGNNEGARPRVNSNRDDRGGWSMAAYYKQLDEEKIIYKKRFQGKWKLVKAKQQPMDEVSYKFSISKIHLPRPLSRR